MAQKCLECGTEINGRIDKKFCDDQCRNTFNNRLKRDQNNYIRNVNNTLRKNRRILAELNPNGKSKAKREEMLLKGFNFNYFTNVYITKDKRTYYYCYDYAYLEIDNDWYALVMKKDWVK